MTTIVSIHGHGATPLSFSYLKSQAPRGNWLDLSYNSQEGHSYNLYNMTHVLEKLVGCGSDIYFVTHSMGALYAAYLSHAFEKHVVGGMAISAPWQGSASAYTMQVIDPSSKIYKDIVPTSPIVLGASRCNLAGDWVGVISNAGQSKMIVGDNDGVLTVDSMMGRKGIDYKFVNANHYEVMMSKVTSDILNYEISKLQEDV